LKAKKGGRGQYVRTPLLSAAQLGDKCGVPRKRIVEWRTKGHIPPWTWTVLPDGEIRYVWPKFLAWLEACRLAPPDSLPLQARRMLAAAKESGPFRERKRRILSPGGESQGEEDDEE
jgi:hypothetical protein